MLPPDTLPPAEMLLALQALNDFWINYLLYKYKHQESPEYPELYAAVRAEALRNLRGDADLTAEQRQVRRCLPGTYQPLKTPLLIHLSAPRLKRDVLAEWPDHCPPGTPRSAYHPEFDLHELVC